MSSVKGLRAELQHRGLDTTGKKAELQARLLAAENGAARLDDDIGRGADDADWEQPPAGVDGEPLRVDFRINVSIVDDVRTKESDAFVKIGVVFCESLPSAIGPGWHCQQPG